MIDRFDIELRWFGRTEADDDMKIYEDEDDSKKEDESKPMCSGQTLSFNDDVFLRYLFIASNFTRLKHDTRRNRPIVGEARRLES